MKYCLHCEDKIIIDPPEEIFPFCSVGCKESYIEPTISICTDPEYQRIFGDGIREFLNKEKN